MPEHATNSVHIIKLLSPLYQSILGKKLLVCLLMPVCTCNNTDGNNLVIFFSIALYYSDTYIRAISN